MAEATLILTKAEEEILTNVGYLVMKWNYAEYCARQILRRQIQGGSLSDPEHMKLSNRSAGWIENELRDRTLPLWTDPGRRYLESLIDAYAAAREHRNHIVHGFWMTSGGGGSTPAQGILNPSKPIAGKNQLITFFSAADLRSITDHFHALGAAHGRWPV